MKPLSLIAIAALCLSLAQPVYAACPSIVFTTVQTRTDANWIIYDLHTLDYDDDGKLDVVGLRQETNGGGASLLAWRGAGDGTFASPVSLGTSDVHRMIVADVNNDNRLDIIMAVPSELKVRLGNGNGFDAAIVVALFFLPTRLAAVSLDGDGFVDLVISGAAYDVVKTYHGVGNGNFTPGWEVATARFPASVAAADFDADGRVDIAYSLLETNTVEVVFKNSNGSYTAPVSLQSGAVPVSPHRNYVTGLAVADVDEDGRPDLVTSNWEDASHPEKDASVAILRNEGSRTFSRSVLVPGIRNASGHFQSLLVRDFDGDGHADIAASSVNGGLVMVAAGQGDGAFNSPTFYIPSGDYWVSGGGSQHFHSVAIGDFNGDGAPDLAVGASKDFSAATGACGTQVTLFSVSPVITSGQLAPLRARVGGVGSATALPRGTVTFREGASVLGVVDVGANGYADLDVSGLSLGNHTVTADFSGNAALSAATSPSIVQQVTSQTTSTVIAFPGTQSVYGTPYTFSVVIYSPSNVPINRWYTLEIDGVTSQRWNGAQVTVQLSPGPHTITASFVGDNSFPKYPPSTSGPQIITTAKATPSMTNSGGALSVRAGEAHTLQFTLTGPNGFAAPTGSVQLKRGSTVLGTGVVTGGTASVSATLERGTHAVTAIYSGDGNFNDKTLDLTLSVLPNLALAIDARGLQNAVSVRTVLPPNTTSTALFRSPAGAGTWSQVIGWTPQSEYDHTAATGVLYDYRLSAMVSGSEQTSNVDAALIFHDDPVVPSATLVKRAHFDELRLAVNALRSNAGLPPFDFDGTYAGSFVKASHLASLRTALAEARQTLGMVAAAFTDQAIAGTLIKAVHIQELRDQSR